MKQIFKWFLFECVRLIAFLYIIGMMPSFGAGFLMPLLAAMAYLFLVWRNTRKVFGELNAGARSIKSKDGIDRKWEFNCPNFQLIIDYEAESIRLKARKATWAEMVTGKDGGKWKTQRVDFTFPLESFTMSQYEVVATGFIPNSATGTAWVDGHAVPVTVQTGGGITTTTNTGRHRVTFRSAILKKSVSPSTDRMAESVRRGADGNFWHSSYVTKNVVKEVRVEIKAEIPGGVFKKFLSAWGGNVAPRLDQIVKQDDEALLADYRKLAESEYMKTEGQQRKVFEDAKAKANATWNGLSASAGIKGDFSAWNYDPSTGEIHWLAAVDKSGRGLFVANGEQWHGSMANAKSLVLDVPPANKNAPTNLQLEIEVHDPDYERTNLKRRRFKIMTGRPREEIVEWSDRINILAEQTGLAAQLKGAT
ncbi:MAG: hypothetical protein K0M48_08815 [Thiobacillus sp.]|nr:hypothetical protein [Thiobacillus sp.]